MSDLDTSHAQRDAISGVADLGRATRYSDAVNRYLGAVGYLPDERPRPVLAVDPTPAGAVAKAGVVLVGVDDTPTSYTAVDHAAIEAEMRGWDLRILHVQRPGGIRQPSRDAGARLLERLTDRVHAYLPSVAVTCRLAVGSPSPLLAAEARAADLVVVGHRHSAVGTEFGLSVGDRVAANHPGTVLVVRVPGWPPGPEFGNRPIVVGVDHAQSPAVAFALAEARLRGCDLVMLHAGKNVARADRFDAVDGVRVHHREVAGDPASALIDASNNAAAVVVGRSGLLGLPVKSSGWIGRSMVQHAYCPVFLVG